MANRGVTRGLADQLVRAVDGIAGPVPVNLEALAASLGVREIVSANMTEDGRTTWSAGRPRIELRAGRPPNRNRFTLAHEIGHILIAQDEIVARRTLALETDDLEKLCDWIAASILMPRQWITQHAARDRYNLSLLRRIAHKADVSLAAAAVRLGEVSERTCILLRWQRAPSRWVVVGQAAVPRQYSGILEATPETSQEFDRLPSRRDLWRTLTLVADGARLTADAHVDRGGKPASRSSPPSLRPRSRAVPERPRRSRRQRERASVEATLTGPSLMSAHVELRFTARIGHGFSHGERIGERDWVDARLRKAFNHADPHAGKRTATDLARQLEPRWPDAAAS